MRQNGNDESLSLRRSGDPEPAFAGYYVQVADRPGWRTVAFSAHLNDAESLARKLRSGGFADTRRADVRAISLEALARDGGADALRRAAEELEALALELSVSRARD